MKYKNNNERREKGRERSLDRTRVTANVCQAYDYESVILFACNIIQPSVNKHYYIVFSSVT